jgi:hypothetical protein
LHLSTNSLLFGVLKNIFYLDPNPAIEALHMTI